MANVPLSFLMLMAVSVSARGDDDCDRDGDRGHTTRVEWPSSDGKSLQAAIDDAPDGATLELHAGVFAIERPLTVRKRLTIRGAGTDRRDARHRTVMNGGPPQPVVDDRGAMILPADAVEGMWNFLGADVTIEQLELTGFDAGIVAKPDATGRSGATTVRDVEISNTGRGILSLSAGDVKVSHSSVTNARWNGISVAPPLRSAPPHFDSDQFKAIDPQNAGIYYSHVISAHYAAYVSGAKGSGLIGVDSWSTIDKSDFLDNDEAGIYIAGGVVQINDNYIAKTHFVLASQQKIFGNGLFLERTPENPLTATVSATVVEESDATSLVEFGASSVTLANDSFNCGWALYNIADPTEDFDTEPLFGTDQNGLHDAGGNVCGCTLLLEPPHPCEARSSQLGPPPPVAGLE